MLEPRSPSPRSLFHGICFLGGVPAPMLASVVVGVGGVLVALPPPLCGFGKFFCASGPLVFFLCG